jgi:deazaflavin-dependent oxidoreductase (nitroreductase family)
MSTTGEYAPSPSAWVRKQVDEIERTGTTDSVHVKQRPVVMLTMRGARTGAVRKVPVMRVEHGGSFAAVASQGGAPTHPKWYHNLVAHPEVELQVGTDTFPVRARELSGPERDEWWERCVAAFPDYAVYQRRTDRLIPVFVLEPRDA